MFLITIPSAKGRTLQELASSFGVEVYSRDALSVDKPSVVGELARYLCKAGVSFEVQPWD